MAESVPVILDITWTGHHAWLRTCTQAFFPCFRRRRTEQQRPGFVALKMRGVYRHMITAAAFSLQGLHRKICISQVLLPRFDPHFEELRE